MSGDLVKRLIGQQLKNGWKIVRERKFPPKGTGCNHSIACIADDPDGKQAFVKVLDPTVNRHMPEHLHGLHLRLRHRKQWYELDIDGDKFTLSIDDDGPEPVTVRVGEEILELKTGGSYEFPLRRDVTAPPQFLNSVSRFCGSIRPRHWRF